MKGHRYAYAGVTVGLAVSVWANVAHQALQAGGADRGSLALAGFWPLGLFLALEILARTEWASGLTVVAARAGVVVVALVAGLVSYQHLHGLLQLYGEAALPAAIGPLGIDGLMLVSAAALLQRPAAAEAEPVPVEVPGPVLESSARAGEPVPAPGLEAVTDPVRKAAPAPPPAQKPQPVPVAAARTERPATVTARTGGGGPRTAAGLLPQARDAVQRGHLGPGPSAEAIRRHLRCSPATARGLRDQLRETA